MRARIPACTACGRRRDPVRKVSVRSTSRGKTEMLQPGSPLFQTESPRTTQLISTRGKKRLGSPSLTQPGPATAVSAPHSESPAAVSVSHLSYSPLQKGTQSIQGLREKEIKKKQQQQKTSFQRSRLSGIPVSVFLKHLMTGVDSKQLLNSR